MRFLVLLAGQDHFDRWDALDDATRDRAMADFAAFGRAVREAGTIVAGDALHRPETARTLGDGLERIVTDGPYAETKEQLNGFYLIDVPDLDTAVRLARLLPREVIVEVRPTLGVTV
jgi:hypothetical protein